MSVPAGLFFTLELLTKSWEEVKDKGNKSCGVDGVSIDDFDPHEELPRLLEELRTGEYTPAPVRRITIKEGPKERKIGIYTVRDKVVQQALLFFLEPLFEPEFLDCSSGTLRGAFLGIREDLRIIEEILKKLQALRKHQRGIARSIRKYEQQLSAVFDRCNTDRMEIEAGVLVRNKRGEEVKWFIEI